MLNISRTILARFPNSFWKRHPRKDQLLRLALARYSTVPPNGNAEGREDRTPQSPKINSGMLAFVSGVALGGLGYAGYKYLTWEEANCAEQVQDANCAEQLQGDEKCKRCKNKCGDTSECIHKMDKEEKLIEKTNQDFEQALKEVKLKATEATEIALEAYCEACDIIKSFMDKAYCAIEEKNLDSTRFEEVWCEVFDWALRRCRKLNEANLKGQCAWNLLCNLREVIDNGKACKYTTCNPLIITAEETLRCCELEILNAKAKMDCIQSESRLVEQYRNIVEDFRNDLKAEMESLLTGNPECRTNLTENECNMMLTHVYKKILRVQKELSIVKDPKSSGCFCGKAKCRK